MQRARERFQSTPSVGRATSNRQSARPRLSISIHALREEGDPPSGWMVVSNRDFNPRSPWGERREQEIIIRAALEFQSTPSARRATADSLHSGCSAGDFNPRSPWGERRWALLMIPMLLEFQSTPSARRATYKTVAFNWVKQFQSTPSARRATPELALTIGGTTYFNPRPPRGGRRLHGRDRQEVHQFQSTPSARRATLVLCGRAFWLAYFNPRPPRGERPAASSASAAKTSISIHALREESDYKRVVDILRNA